MANHTQRASTPRTAALRATLPQLLKLRAIHKLHPEATFTTTPEGIAVRFLPAWLADGWLRMGDLVQTSHDGAICHLVPDDGKLTGYCERKPTEAQAPYCGSRNDPTPKALRRKGFKPLAGDAIEAAITKARKAA